MKCEFIFLGAPASGKGTQTKKLAEDLNIPHIDTGGMLRTAISNQTESGKIAKSYIDKGQLVPTNIVAKIVEERLMKPDTENGFILDGYPRNLDQANALDEILKNINKGEKVGIYVINIDVPESILIDRITNRRYCENCGAIYNLKFYPPKNDEKCDICGGKLIQRSDDTKETAEKRLNTYKNETEPLIQYYCQRNVLNNVDGNRDIEEIYKDIHKIAEDCSR